MMEGRETIAPFVMKTYQMVTDPATHPLIRWGGSSNSFLVPDPLEFSQRVLPVYFKHNNFSSFVRQLNTYGFRKVDPDRWEFANEWFLQGQVHLLKNIVRRKHSRGLSGASGGFYNPTRVDVDRESWDEDEILIEISKLKEEQRSMDVEMRAMCKRLDATEQRPHRMLAFLNNAVDDPELILRIMSQKDKQHSNHNQLELVSISPDKKRRICHNATSSSSSSSLATTIRTEDDIDPNPTTLLSPDRTGWCQSPESSSSAWFNDPLGSIHPAARSAGSAAYGGDKNSGRYGEGFGYSHAVDEEANPTPPPYPFALYRGGF